MTVLLVVGFLIAIGVGFYFIDRSRDPDRHKGTSHWQPDVDRAKAETMKNLETPPER
jgi:hypothetical protein